MQDNLEVKCDVKDPKGCTDKEKKFIETMQAKSAEDRSKELTRLNGMAVSFFPQQPASSPYLALLSLRHPSVLTSSSILLSFPSFHLRVCQLSSSWLPSFLTPSLLSPAAAAAAATTTATVVSQTGIGRLGR